MTMLYLLSDEKGEDSAASFQIRRRRESGAEPRRWQVQPRRERHTGYPLAQYEILTSIDLVNATNESGANCARTRFG